ncbi:unnamed protein product [Caenorhabditis auriculariae]|uniref:Skp1-related protein n=1 Tax=Caenorhabditis auriculariae TaxID=2777116 RepID=A0A8S1HFW1_9PELO|nr:unnamed protein product [Caenorhabditis auriculariae]
MSSILNYFFRPKRATTEEGQSLQTVESVTSTAAACTPGERRILRSSDGAEVTLCAEDVRQITVIYNMFQALPPQSDETPTVIIPVALSADVVDKIVKWCRTPQKNARVDTLFPGISVPEALNVIEACLFLEIGSLCELVSKWVADKLEGKTREEMRLIMGRPESSLSQESKTMVKTGDV